MDAGWGSRARVVSGCARSVHVVEIKSDSGIPRLTNVRALRVVKIAQLDVELPAESERLQEVVQEWLGKKRTASGKVQAVLRILDPGQLRCVRIEASRLRDGGEASRARF